MSQRTNITQNNFFAWSLYTAYRDPITIGNWVAAEWPGKPITTELELQTDLECRLDALEYAFTCAVNAPGKNDWVRYFVVPEFYFHSFHGPYPGISINGKSAFDYVRDELSSRLLAVLKGSPEACRDWVICTGSMLTTHVENIAEFGQSAQATARLDELNQLYAAAVQQGGQPVPPISIGLSRVKASTEPALDTTDPFYEFNAAVNGMRQDPLCTVRNRALIFVYNSVGGGSIHSRVIEKLDESTVDLTLGVLSGDRLDSGWQITEWMANYPPVSIISGDHQHQNDPASGTAPSAGARMSIVSYGQPVELGGEICLDHRLQRLRRTVDMQGNAPLDIQLVPSGGMQLLDYGIAAGANGAAFNADGCDYLLDQYNSSGVPVITKDGKPSSGTYKGVITGVYTSAAQTRSEAAGIAYFSHSQLSYRTDADGPPGYNNPLALANPGGVTNAGSPTSPSNPYLDAYQPPAITPLKDGPGDVDDYFVAGLGELHQYSV